MSAESSRAAQEIKKLRRPSQAAWLVNQLALRHGDAVEELLAVGSRLRKLEDEMLAGEAITDALRAAAAEERDRDRAAGRHGEVDRCRTAGKS